MPGPNPVFIPFQLNETMNTRGSHLARFLRVGSLAATISVGAYAQDIVLDRAQFVDTTTSLTVIGFDHDPSGIPVSPGELTTAYSEG